MENKIASITITLNDFHSLDQWKSFYNQYKSSIYKHIIVDNNSNTEYKNLLYKNFPDSTIIERNSNGGTTAAYNDGIKKALEDNNVDSIMLIANDIQIDRQSIPELHKTLFSDVKIGAVAPLLLNSDRKTILTYGEKLGKDMGLIRLYEGMLISDELPTIIDSDCLPGGMNLAKREIYEKVGLQDETLFMYMDENDYWYRTKNTGYYLLATKNVVASHCHIITEGKQNDNSLAWFYINRNHLLVCRKYRNTSVTLKLFFKKFFLSGLKMSFAFLKEKSVKKIVFYNLGLFYGIIGSRRNFIVKK